MKIRWLEYFIAVAEEQSVSRATLRLNTSQAGLSRVIRELEQMLKAELFQRTGRGMILTAEGEILLAEAREVVRSYAQFVARVEDIRGDRAGTLRILLPMRLSAFLMPSFMDDFDAQFTKAVAEVFEALNEDIQTQIRSAKADIGIYYSPLSFGNDLGEHIGSEALYIAGTPDLIGPEAVPITMEEASQLPILMQSSPAMFRDHVEASFTQNGYALTVAHNLNTIHTHLQFARAGKGATILAFSAVGRSVLHGSLNARKIVEPEIIRDIYLGTASQATTRLQREGIKILKAAIAARQQDLRWTLI
jgi:LysR family transcriptional regulator, nitrogen assimilation regulatory protein